MSDRMHLRAKLAMEFYKLTVLANSEDDRSRDACIAWAVPAADALLAELQKGEPLAQEPETEECGCVHPNDALVRAFQRRTRLAEARAVAQDGIIEARSKALNDAEARVRDLTAQIEALNHLDEEAADEAREWKERAERAEARQENQASCLRDTLEENRKLKDLLTEERRLHGLTTGQLEACRRDKSALSLAIQMRKELKVSKNEGGVCGRDECPGILAYPLPVENCTCHLSPPCAACTDNPLTCSVCGWDERDT